MKHTFDSPKEAVIVFTPRYDGTCRKPLVIPRCTRVKTGKEIIVHYLAKNDKEHAHTYKPYHILKLLVGKETIYEESELSYRRRMNTQIRVRTQAKRTFERTGENQLSLRAKRKRSTLTERSVVSKEGLD